MNTWFLRLKGRCLTRMLQAGVAITSLALLPSAGSAASGSGQQTDSVVGIEELAEKKPCDPVAVYGPPMCSSDEECTKQHGDGWYCNKDHGYDDGCGGRIEWPVCEQKPPEGPKVEPKVDEPTPKEPQDDPGERCLYGPPTP